MFGFLKRLFLPKPITSNPEYPGFKLLDVGKVAAERRLKHHGNKDGVHNVPATGETKLSIEENQIIGMGIDLLKANRQHYDMEFQSYSARRAALTPEGMLSEAKMKTKALLDDIASLPLLHTADYSMLRKKKESTAKELKIFKIDHGLEGRAASFPDSTTLHFGVMMIIFVIESLVNTNLLAKGNELGLLGGWIDAFVISFLNVVILGSIMCYGVRLLVHYQTRLKAFGIILVITFGMVAIAFNLLVAHYRNALGGDSPELAGSMAWDMLTTAPLDIGDTQSVTLLAIGLSVVGVAALDWLKMDDIYLHYGRITRNQIEALNDYAGFHYMLVNERLVYLQNKANDIISGYITTAANAASEDAKVMARMTVLNSLFDQSVKSIEKDVNQLLQIYRGANKSHRDTEPPAYFEEEWKYEEQISFHQILPPKEMPAINVFISTLEPLQQELKERCNEVIQALNEMGK